MQRPRKRHGQGLVQRADRVHQSSQHAVDRIAQFGASHIRDGDTILTHCNSEVALACIIEAHRQGKEIEVFATEVRPRNQGLITIRTLNDEGIKTNFIVDSAVRSFIHDIDLVIVGADAVTVNGAVVNKIGTAQVAHSRPGGPCQRDRGRGDLQVCAPHDPRRTHKNRGAGRQARSLPDEIARTLPHVTVRNPAFDVTPAEYIDMIVTEKGAIPPQMAYVIIRDYLGWGIDEFHTTFGTAGLNGE